MFFKYFFTNLIFLENVYKMLMNVIVTDVSLYLLPLLFLSIAFRGNLYAFLLSFWGTLVFLDLFAYPDKKICSAAVIGAAVAAVVYYCYFICLFHFHSPPSVWITSGKNRKLVAGLQPKNIWFHKKLSKNNYKNECRESNGTKCC